MAEHVASVLLQQSEQMVWRSVRAGGDTKTRKSHRTLKLPQRCVDVLHSHRARQDQFRRAAGTNWYDNDLDSRPGSARPPTLRTSGVPSAGWPRRPG